MHKVGAWTLLSMLLGLSVCVSEARAKTINVSSCASSDVQNAINAAADGDIVVLPPCSVTWGATVRIPASKGITLDGNGAFITRGNLSDWSPLVAINPSSVTPTRVTRFDFTDSKVSQGYFITVSGGTEKSAKFRIDHCTFTGLSMGRHIGVNSPIYGVIDHNTFTWTRNGEVIHNEAYGATSTEGWANDVIPGSPEALYIEDNRFINITSGNPAYFWGGSAVQGYYGARTVFRYNYLEMAQVDMHGTPGMVGARWWEVYENTFYIVPNGDQDKAMGMRAGSGVIFNNRKIGRTTYKGDIVLVEEDSGYPALYQIGRGKMQSPEPAYVWGNDATFKVYSGSFNVQANRDFYLTPKPGYTPYTYPHPMVTGTGAPPPPPGNLVVR